MNSGEILQRIKEIEARAARATPGPWNADGQFVRPSHDSPQYAECGHLEESWNEETFANAQFIAHSREDVPWLCQIVRQLVARLEKLEAVAKAAREYLPDIDAPARDEPTICQYEPGKAEKRKKLAIA